jgi:hypothetical protein
MKTAWTLTLLLCITASPFAETQEQKPSVDESGNAFLSQCELVIDRYSMKDKEGSPVDAGECYGYVTGFNHGVGMAYDIVGQPQPYCLPDGVTHGQMMRVLIKFIKDHPEKAHKLTGVLEIESFMDAFPCKQPSKKR